jgi:hypothetical protein
MGGHELAVTWLSRFLLLLPDEASPLPLVVAPVLDAFLHGAGHMMAKKHADEFRPLLDKIIEDVINRLDEGVIGKPSATRLKKTVSRGFDGFTNTLPSKALPALYYGAEGTPSRGVSSGISLPGSSTGQSPFGSSTTGQSLFGGASQSAPNNSGFGLSNQQGSLSSKTSPFGGSAVYGSQSQSPFSGGIPAQATMSSTSSFGGAVSNQPGAQSSPFGGTMSNQVGIQSSALGGTTLSQGGMHSSPFGGSSANQTGTQGSFFGSLTANQTVTQNIPFGGATSNVAGTISSSFRGENTNQAGTNSNNPFSSNPHQYPSSFGGASTSAPSPFGAPLVQGNGNPFGSNQLTQQNSTNFGGGMQNQSSSVSFGSMLASNNAASPFGTNIQHTPSPFSVGPPNNYGSTNSSGGGGYQGVQQAGGRSRPACKFFAQGKCRFNKNCKFSHEQVPGAHGSFGGGGAFGAGSGGQSNPFGGRPF